MACPIRCKIADRTSNDCAVRRRKLTPRQLEKLLDIPQPRVSELVNGKIFARMTSDRLVTYLHRLGRAVEIRTKPQSPRPTEAA